MRESQRQIISASLKDQSLWSGTLQVQPEDSQVSIPLTQPDIPANTYSKEIQDSSMRASVANLGLKMREAYL